MVDQTSKIVEQFVYCLFRGHQMMPVLYYLPPSPPCRSVLLLGKMLDIEFDLRAINVLEAEQLKPEFVQVGFFLYFICYYYYFLSRKCIIIICVLYYTDYVYNSIHYEKKIYFL